MQWVIIRKILTIRLCRLTLATVNNRILSFWTRNSLASLWSACTEPEWSPGSSDPTEPCPASAPCWPHAGSSSGAWTLIGRGKQEASKMPKQSDNLPVLQSIRLYGFGYGICYLQSFNMCSVFRWFGITCRGVSAGYLVHGDSQCHVAVPLCLPPLPQLSFERNWLNTRSDWETWFNKSWQHPICFFFF